MSSKKSLENIVKSKEGDNHVKHFDPVDAISHHVVLVIFLCMLFLFSLVLFFTSEQNPASATAYAIMQFKTPTVFHSMGAGISGFISNVRQSEDRPLILLTLYTFWIVIFGLVNMALYERNLQKDHRKKK